MNEVFSMTNLILFVYERINLNTSSYFFVSDQNHDFLFSLKKVKENDKEVILHALSAL